MNRYGRKILRKQQLNIVDSSISKADLILELHERKVTNFLQEQPKGELLNMYCEEMAGIHRLPALLFEEPDATLESLHLHQYDVLSCEPLHTIKGHITNLFEELPRQVPKKLKNDFSGTIKASFNGKDAKRGSDY